MAMETVREALDRYENARAKLLGREGDTEELWRVVVAADSLVHTVEWPSKPWNGAARTARR